MKHLLNDISQEDKNSILEQHVGGIRIDSDNFRVAKSKSYARQGFAIDITSQGTGGDNKFSVINDADHILVEADDDFGFNETSSDWT